MKCGAVLCACLLAVIVSQSNGLKILRKIKDLIHPTTTTTSERPVPVLPEFEKEDQSMSYSSAESKEDKHGPAKTTTERNQGSYFSEDSNSKPIVLSTTPISFESSSSQYADKQDFPTIKPPQNMGVYPGMPNVNSTSTKDTHPEEPDQFLDAIDCSRPSTEDNFLSSSIGQTNPGSQVLPGKCANAGNSITQGSSNSTDSGDIIYPDNPVLRSTSEPVVAVTTARTKKAHVPVAVDDGRRILDAPTKDCGPGKKADENGRCRIVARR